MKKPKNLPFRFAPELIAKGMEDLGLDDAALSRRLAAMGYGFFPGKIRAYRTGRQRPSVETLAALADALETPMRLFVVRTEEEKA